MKTITDELKNPSLIPNMSILYVYADAFTKCDCGKDLMLSQRVFGDNTYRGICSCGLSWALLNGKIKSWKL